MEYIHKVYDVGKMIRAITDTRKRKAIKTHVVSYLLFFAFVLQISSFNRMRYFLEDNKRRFQHLIGKKNRIPKIDAIRDVVYHMDQKSVQSMFDHIIDRAIENKVLRENTINGLRVAAVDGVELFSSKLKSCENCLTREVKGEMEYFHKAVVCMTVGSDPHIALGIEMLRPKHDGSNKDDGEHTGVKRLLTTLQRTHHHFADVIVADALYMNAPFINLVKGLKMDVVIRAKDERLHIVQDALGLFKNREKDEVFKDTNKEVYVWDDHNFSMEGCAEDIRFLRFEEHWTSPKGRKMHREMWCITTLPKGITAHTVWLIMRKRWDIENNGFRMLKTYFHADHCYIHGNDSNEKVLLFIVMAFNLMELFLFRRLQRFRERRLLRIDIIASMFDDLLVESYEAYFHSG